MDLVKRSPAGVGGWQRLEAGKCGLDTRKGEERGGRKSVLAEEDGPGKEKSCCGWWMARLEAGKCGWETRAGEERGGRKSGLAEIDGPGKEKS